MKVKCMECGLVYEVIPIYEGEASWEGMCLKCGSFRWVMSLEDSEKLFNKPEEKSIVENPYIPKNYKIRIIIYDILKQINKDYRKLIERHLLADLPINSDLDILYKAELERIENIKI